MKRLLSMFILGGILMQSFGSVIVTHFQLNKRYIASVLCENKAKPKLRCNGKCQLKKKLTLHEKREKVPNSPVKEKIEILQYCQNTEEEKLLQQPSFKTKAVFTYLEAEPALFYFSIFHPPSA